MATFDEIMQAAANADKAGDTDAAQKLVDMARQYIPAPVESDVMMPTAYDPSEPAPAQKMDRFGDTIKAATKGPIAATKAFGAGLVNQDDSISLQNMPDWVPGPLRRPAATLADTAMTGLGAAGTAYAFGAGLVGEAVGGSPTQEKKLARDLMMMGEVAVPQLAGSSGALVATAKAAKAAERIGSKVPTELQASARAAEDLGITPSLGAGGKGRAMTAATLEKVPLSGGVIAKDATRFVGDVERAFDSAVSRVGPVTGAERAGGALQSGLSKYVVDFKEKASGLYNRVGDKIPETTMIQAPETVGMIRDALAPFADKPEIAKRLGLNSWAGIADDLESGLSWRAASDLRTKIGESIGKITGPMADMDQGRLKQVYGKLTDDMEAAAKAAGPEAEAAWRRANNYYKRGAARISNDLDKTISAKNPERAFEAFAAMTKADRAGSDANRLYKIKASMPRDQWGEVAATIVDRLGRATPGAQNAAGDVFSPTKFLTEWNKMSAEAKRVLLPQDVRVELDKLAKVSDLAKTARAERNFSNSGAIVTGAGVGAAGVTAPVHTALFLGGAWGSSKLLTTPHTLRALNKLARGDAREMRAMANGNGPFAQDAATVLRMTAAEAAQGGIPANREQLQNSVR